MRSSVVVWSWVRSGSMTRTGWTGTGVRAEGVGDEGVMSPLMSSTAVTAFSRDCSAGEWTVAIFC